MKISVTNIIISSLLILCSLRAYGDTVALSDDPNFIQASILTATPGDLSYQYLGHAAIRMQCPTYDLDRVFSFENNSEGKIGKLFIEGAQGRIIELEFDEYLQDFINEGREVKSYPLNLSLNQKARLWEVLDSMKLLPDRPFDKDIHCFSVLGEAVNIAASPGKINWGIASLQWPSYGIGAQVVTKDKAPWNYVIMMLPLGELADKQGNGLGFVYPIAFDWTFEKYFVTYPDGVSVQLIEKNPVVVLQEKKAPRPNRPTPIEIGVIVIAIIFLISLMQLFGKWERIGKGLDIVLWIIITIGGILLSIVTWAPGHYGASWNWPLLVFNPVAWIPILIFRRNKNILCGIWIFYTFVLFGFGAFINILSPSIDIFWRLLACGIAIRCAWHSFTLLTIHKLNPKNHE